MSTRRVSCGGFSLLPGMPECYCGPGGVIHAGSVNDNCQRAANTRCSQTMQGESAVVKQEKGAVGKSVANRPTCQPAVLHGNTAGII